MFTSSINTYTTKQLITKNERKYLKVDYHVDKVLSKETILHSRKLLQVVLTLISPQIKQYSSINISPIIYLQNSLCTYYCLIYLRRFGNYTLYLGSLFTSCFGYGPGRFWMRRYGRGSDRLGTMGSSLPFHPPKTHKCFIKPRRLSQKPNNVVLTGAYPGHSYTV